MPEKGKKRKAQIEAAVKEKIADAVLGIFKKRHPKKLTIDMAARESGISKGMLYKYFKDKDDLVAFTMLHALKSYRAKDLEIAGSALPAAEKLRATAAISLKGTEEAGELVGFAFRSASVYSKGPVMAANKRRAENFRRVDGIMKEGLRQGVFGGADARNLTLYFAGLIRCAYRMRSNLPPEKRRSFQDEADAILARFLGGVRRGRPNAQAE